MAEHLVTFSIDDEELEGLRLIARGLGIQVDNISLAAKEVLILFLSDQILDAETRITIAQIGDLNEAINGVLAPNIGMGEVKLQPQFSQEQEPEHIRMAKFFEVLEKYHPSDPWLVRVLEMEADQDLWKQALAITYTNVSPSARREAQTWLLVESTFRMLKKNAEII